MTEAYSNCEQTNEMYACFLSDGVQFPRFLLNRPRVPPAFEATFPMLFPAESFMKFNTEVCLAGYKTTFLSSHDVIMGDWRPFLVHS